MGGAFQISRDIFDSSIWEDTVKFRLFFYILGNATHKDGVKVGEIVLSRGQYLRSYRNLQKDLEYLEGKARKQYQLSMIERKIKQLVREERLSIIGTEYGTLFTVTKYDYYQCLDNYKSVTQDSNRTVIGQIQDNNKNDKNEKNKDIVEIVEYLNKKIDKKFKASSAATSRHIKARLADGFTLDDFKIVINVKSIQWLNDKNMSKYLRPETLFGTKFEAYLNENKSASKDVDPNYQDTLRKLMNETGVEL